MADITRERAREIISEIYYQSGGFLADNEREGALASVLGAPVLEAAGRAWTSDTRFIYELIQNADDASYHCALSEKKDRKLRFYVYPDRVVVQSNQDGFDESDVRAICSAGRRTKTGQIGEKGIGFKSVFKVAYKVIIQSGPFCFSLQHRAGQNGLGMIAPVNEAHEYLDSTVRTRMTLLTLQPELYSSLYSLVMELPPSTFAFLSNLDFVHFEFSDPKMPRTWVYSPSLVATYLYCIKYEKDESRTHRFFYFSRQVPGLPARESRPSAKEVDIVLAFPLDNQLQLSTQPFAHAYLPLRGDGVNFLVQSDFVTRNNREDLAICPWNDHLLSHLPRVFYAALEVLCRKPDFEAIWPRFLPLKELQEPHWSQFRDSVLKDLKHLRLFKTREGTLKPLDEVRYLLPEHCDSNGDPLFDDSDEDIYLSSQYSESYDLLKTFGLRPVSSRQLLNKIYSYLNGPQPRLLHDKLLDSDWHARVALLLSSWMDSPDMAKEEVEELKRLPLVPVQDATWTFPPSSPVLKSPSNSDIYFPLDTAGNVIPDSMLNLVPVSYVMDEPRKQLFSRLGVKRAEPSFVLEKIREFNESILRTLSLSQSISNLRYVFSVRPDWKLVDPRCILLHDSDGKIFEKTPRWEMNKRLRKTSDLYFTNAVLQEAGKVIAASGHAPLQIRFLHPDYITPFGADTSWILWLERVGSIRRAPRLETRHSPAQPSDILLSIVKYAPSFLIRILRAHWEIYEEELANAFPGTVSTIKKAVVPVECGTAALERSFLGTSEQRAIWSGTHLKGRFPFLSIPTGWESEDCAEWKFLGRFGVTTTITTDFLMASAKELSRVFPRRRAKDAFFRLYEMLTADSFEEFCAQMSGTEFIYLPQLGTDDMLVRPSDCLWDGDVSGTKHVLASHDTYTQNPSVKRLFQTVLSSQGAEWVRKLSYLKMKTTVSSNSLYDVYNAIMEGPEDDRCWTPIRDGFENGEYIYVLHKDIWCPPSLCVWSACPYIDGRYGIRHHYPDLRHLFVEGLRISQPDIPAYIEEILFMAQVGKISISKLLLVMQELNSLNPTADDLEPLKFARFIPVRCKAMHIAYVTPDEPFFIIDDTRLQLDPEVPVLDITPEDACRLRHFFAALGLETQYVSRQIRETTCDAINDAVESVELTHDFRQRVEALCQCAIYYGGMRSMLPRNKIQRLFSQATVFTAKGFRRHFHLDHGLATKESHEGRLHYEEINGSLRLYIPWDKKQRAICYATELPHALVRYLEVDHQAACGTFATILRESPDILDEILAEKGIIRPAMGLSNELPIRTKSQLAPKDIGTNFASSLASNQARDRLVSIELKANKQYLDKLNSSLRYLTTLTKKYSITGADLDENDSSGIISKYFNVKHEDRELTFTEAALKAAAESLESDQMDLLLNDLDAQGQVIAISPSVLEAAAQNEMCGDEIMYLLGDISESYGQSMDITDAILEAAAENEVFGPLIMAILLQCLTDQDEEIIITDAVLKAAAGNTESGDDLVAYLLLHRDQGGWIAEDIVMTAARNEALGHQIMRLLLKGPGNIRMSPAIFQAAAENLHQGAEIMALLLSENRGDIQVTEEVIISALHNSVSGLEILTLLGDRNHGHLEVTERIMLAAAESGNCMEVIDLLVNLDKGNLPITNAVLETAARNPASTQKDLIRLLELSDSDMQVTEAFFDTAVYMPQKLTFLLHHQGRITERVMVAAAAREEYDSESSFQSLLAAPHDPVTDAVFEAAVGNSLHGADFVQFLLARYATNIHISETSLLAAARNRVSGPEILALFLKQWPDVRIPENVLLVAAGTDTNAVEKLIRHINDSPVRPPIRITEGLLEAIAGNGSCGARTLRLLLDTQVADKSHIPITQAALVNAAGNIQCGYEVMTLLLDHGGEDLASLITEDVTIAAAGNLLWGLEILALLLDREYTVSFSMRVFAAAERNIWSGEEIVAFLLRHRVLETSEDEDTDTSEDGNWSDESTEVPGSEGSDLSEDAYETADDG